MGHYNCSAYGERGYEPPAFVMSKAVSLSQCRSDPTRLVAALLRAAIEGTRTLLAVKQTDEAAQKDALSRAYAAR